ncbi:sugar ABC transporter permease [Paenibacillus sp.]|jgi:multiple sugar transport system permease protein|uniref:carbohydrate ABC transporter permease n=1 Tax=Paenibacillus sp. TaxID=58172 RepID=UPI00281DC9E6|nr:sugar ABC transporter permease [Paenibacillus sp.]MDR0271495.1 sugar ABC transporter permease [Paenibacillus sp.]
MKRSGLAKRESAVGFLFLSPVFVFYSIFLVIPFFFSLFLSFTEWGGFDLAEIKWVGFANYKAIFSPDSTFLYPILTNTFIFAFGTVLISFVCALGVAYLITRLRWEGLWRTLYFLPAVTTIVAIGNIWLYLYNPTNGLINEIFTWFGIPQQNFLQDSNIALSSIIVVGGWLGIGSSMLILSAGLKAIPEDFYEAAELEGAGLRKVFTGITLPLLKPSITFVLITSFIGGLQSFTLTMVMTKTGGPGDSTNVAGLEMYKQAFSFGNWGLASAMAFVLFVCVMIVTAIQLKFFKRGGVESY